MATNWNEILSNTNNLNDVLSILKKVLAGLEVKADSTTINEALQDIEGLKVDIGAEVENVNTALDQFQTQADEVIAQGFYKGFATEAALKASLPTVSEMRARADDTRKIWRWNRTSAVGVTPIIGTWIDTGLSDKDIAAADATNKANMAENNAIAHADNFGVEQSNQHDVSFAIVDESGKRTWLECGEDGAPTSNSTDIIIEKVTPSITQTVLSEAGIATESGDIGLSFAIVDESGKRTWLECGEDGAPSTYATQLIRSKLEAPVIKPLKIVTIGDSMTYGAGGDGNPYPSRLRALITAQGKSAEVYNAGVGGESSASIVARQGANPFIVNPCTIPASVSPVTITLRGINGLPQFPLYQGSGNGAADGYGAGLVRYFEGKLNGIAGRISLVQPSAVGNVYTPAADDYYTFTRTTAGLSVEVSRPCAFYLDYFKDKLDAIYIIWIGQNNASDIDRAISDAKAVIHRLQDKKYIVISRPVSSAETTTKSERDAVDSKYFAEFGRKFISIRQYLIEYGLADTGKTTTTQDTIDIANGQVPTSLRSDTVHFNAATYQVVAQQVFNRLTELGWI